MPVNYSREVSQEEAAKMTADELIEYAVKMRTPPPRIPTTKDLMNSKYFTFLGVTKKN